jgi:hypothetical protein
VPASAERPSRSAEEGRGSEEFLELDSAGAKAPLGSIRSVPGINPRPTARTSFSPGYEVLPRYKGEWDWNDEEFFRWL